MTQDAAAPTVLTLYEAAVGFLVSERSSTTAWDQVAKHVHERVEQLRPEKNYDILRLLKQEFKAVEKQVKKDYDIKGKMPTSWRSAKATALGALKLGIPLVEDGAAMPKTDVGKLIKAAKNGTLTRTDLDKFKFHVAQALGLYPKFSGADAEEAKHILVGVGTAAGMSFVTRVPRRAPVPVPLATTP